jgi:putative ABC transport system substrate-binding protein
VLVVYGAWHIPQKLKSITPVVFTVVPDPVAQGVVPSLARPGGNITGFSDAHSDLVPKRLEFIKEMAPSTTRVGVVYYPSSMTAMQLAAANSAAPAQGVSLIPAPVKGPQPEEIGRAFSVMTRERASAVLVIADQTVFANRNLMAELAVRHRLIIISTVREWADAGFTIAYGTNFHDLWRRSAIYVDKILKGAKAGELPVEQPTKFDLVINLKTAKAIGITVPRTLVLRADELIE